MATLLKKVERPRELTWYQAGSMLYGDWGTSKAYVLGIAFALAGHASLFFLMAMNVLVVLVGCCYITICRVHPDGGGVYSSVRHRSRELAVIGALLLVADYVVTASISSLDAFHYLGVSHPVLWAIGALALIGVINIFGPTKSGGLATVIALSAVGVLILLCALIVPHMGHVDITPPKGSLFTNWTTFVGIILALSGVEAIANATGIMVEPVGRTARRAIIPVMVEVAVITTILGAAMNAIPGLQGHTEDMIRAIGEFYIGAWFGKIIAVVISLLLISACNTAIMDLVSIMFLMSKDRELPPICSDLNRFGMPWFALAVATVVPILVLLLEHDVTHLAALYAIGVVGAITINIASTGTDRHADLKTRERVFLWAAAIVMLFVEATIIYEKHNAVMFAVSVLAVGLSARAAAKWIEARRVAVPEVLGLNVVTLEEAKDLMPLYHGTTLVALKTPGARLIEEAALLTKGKNEKVIYALYVEEKPPGWAYPEEVEPSRHSVEVLNSAVQEFEKRGITAVPLWNLGENAGSLIVKTSKELELDTVMIGATRRGALERLMRGEVVKTISEQLPENKHLVICN